MHERRRGADDSFVANEENFGHCKSTMGEDGAACYRSVVGVCGRCSDAVDESFDEPTE